ncbi:UDP-N-acetylmuramate dehydrogenase [Larkinella soli]|uniref:UDP-N-acetylmuramate dehydrogenase n=1 Tax=Larkinella soli TaxID=1770527 RepID=UPI000FFB8AD4|nr:UDP-N-acetylmuramate dehydrogenase [Larkinella soli]
MLNIQSYESLKPYNTFGIGAKARYFVEIESADQLQALLQLTDYPDVPKLILGGGSNLLFTRDFEGLALKISIQGIEVVAENEDHIFVRAGAGTNWHELVMFCVRNGYAGVENLSLIPGTVGAAPMQNIGAYGVEIEQVFKELEAVELKTGEMRTFSHADCRFGYRESIFKNEVKGQYIITSVTLRLDRRPVFHTSYGAIQETLKEMGVTDDRLSIKAVSDAVIRIRRSKLPDPAQIGNAGSFFKNPEIDTSRFERLKTDFPALPGYPTGDPAKTKVPAGWLIEQCGWKGKRFGDAGVHAKQALVLVNYGEATGAEILSLARKVQQSVEEKFGISLHPEVNVV